MRGETIEGRTKADASRATPRPLRAIRTQPRGNRFAARVPLSRRRNIAGAQRFSFALVRVEVGRHVPQRSRRRHRKFALMVWISACQDDGHRCCRILPSCKLGVLSDAATRRLATLAFPRGDGPPKPANCQPAKGGAGVARRASAGAPAVDSLIARRRCAPSNERKGPLAK